MEGEEREFENRERKGFCLKENNFFFVFLIKIE